MECMTFMFGITAKHRNMVIGSSVYFVNDIHLNINHKIKYVFVIENKDCLVSNYFNPHLFENCFEFLYENM